MGGFCSRRNRNMDNDKDLLMASIYDFNGWISDLVKIGADVNSYCFGSTPLINAIHFNSYKFADTIIKAGADVNKPDYKGRTPLIVAAERISEKYEERRSEKFVDLLLVAEADVNKADINGGNTMQQKLEIINALIYSHR